MDLLVIVVVLALVVLLVSAPLRGRRGGERVESAERAELDFRTGKLSERDWREVDRGLRAEAVHILRRLDELDGVS